METRITLISVLLSLVMMLWMPITHAQDQDLAGTESDPAQENPEKKVEKPADKSKPTTRKFVPSEEIRAETTVSFPADI